MEQTWKLEDLFASPDDWERELEAVQKDLPSVTKYQGKIGEGASVLLACLNAQEALLQRVNLVATFANLQLSADGTNPVHQANRSKVDAMVASVLAALSFIDSEILAQPEGAIEHFIEQEPELETFRKSLEDLLALLPHKLSPDTEAALAALGQVFGAPYMIYQRSKLSDMQFASIKDATGAEHPNSFALYEDHYEFTPDTTLRRNAYASFVQTLSSYQNTFSATYATEVTKQVAMARLRHYPSVTHMLLQPQQVEVEMYENVLDVIQTELAPHMRRYIKLKQKMLGLDKMLHCDLKVPIDPDYNPEMTFEDGAKLILEALSVMGEEYQGIIKQALTERWVDLADNIGKSTGAFCSSPYGSHPYILLTWANTMRSVFVLAHELGHAGHFSLANKEQRMTNTRPSMVFVEAPSTMHEQILGRHILSKTNDLRMRRYIIAQFLGTYYHNFVTHLLEGELQRRIYTLAEKGESVTARLLSQQKQELLTKFWGDAVEMDDGAALTWMRQPHYYMGLYPYTYSVGLTVSTAMAERIFTEGQPAVNDWLKVLRAGGTRRPLDLMKMAGVDMSTPAPIQKAVAYVGSLVDELEASV